MIAVLLSAAGICLPLPIPICLPPPPVPPPPPPPPIPQPRPSPDTPPYFTAALRDRQAGVRVTIYWVGAQDDNGIVRYRLYRDGDRVATTGSQARRARFHLPCGFHTLSVEAIDTAGQTARETTGVLRDCQQPKGHP